MGSPRPDGRAGGPVRGLGLRTEIGLLLVYAALAFSLSSALQLGERFDEVTRGHRAWHLAELRLSSVVTLVLLGTFLVRRAAREREANRQALASERAAAISSERYRSLFDLHPERAFELDLDGRVVAVNSAFTSRDGFRSEELIGRDHRDFVVAGDRDRAGAAFAAAREGHPSEVEVTMTRADGGLRDLHVTLLPTVVEGATVGVYAIAVDITDRNATVTAILEAREAAERASEAKSDFLAKVNHELRTPLTSLSSAHELIAETDLDPAQEKLVGIVGSSVARLRSIVEDVLDFSELRRPSSGSTLARFEPALLVADAVEYAEGLADPAVLTIGYRVAADVPAWAVGDSSGLGGALRQLLHNAVRFTPQGRVLVTLVRLGVDAELTVLRFEVADTGTGMPPEVQARVFEPFFQAPAPVSRHGFGTGLGLALADRLVARMEGSLSLTSVSGVGSTFTIDVPVLAGPPSQDQLPLAGLGSWPAGR